MDALEGIGFNICKGDEVEEMFGVDTVVIIEIQYKDLGRSRELECMQAINSFGLLETMENVYEIGDYTEAEIKDLLLNNGLVEDQNITIEDYM